MNGQWIGTYTGTSTGSIIVNIDKQPSCFEGIAYLQSQNNEYPITAARFETKINDSKFQFRTSEIKPIYPDTNYLTPWDKIKERYPDAIDTNYAEVNGTYNQNSLTFSWTTNSGETGTCTLPRTKAEQPSELMSEDLSWDEYKQRVSSMLANHYLFRGQNVTLRLRTSFHRTRRANLVNFVKYDIPNLNRHLSAKTKHVFKLSDGNENAAFYNLVQHHGYPTPLLDWTYSPYVAAYFAYRDISKKQAEESEATKNVRIFVLDQAKWRLDSPQSIDVADAKLHVSIGEYLAIENERMIPQQAASTFTNVDDIEWYISQIESQKGRQYLWAYNLPIKERDMVVRELRYMGITAGSMFPGLDGACEELKERNFEI